MDSLIIYNFILIESPGKINYSIKICLTFYLSVLMKSKFGDEGCSVGRQGPKASSMRTRKL